jgi:signal transduction histidine kinase
MRLLAFIFLLLCSVNSLKAQQNSVFVVNGDAVDTKLEGYIYTTKNLKIEDLIKQKYQFKKVEEPSANFGVNDDENWIQFDITNKDSKNKNLVLFLDQTFLEKADFYQFQDDSLIHKIELNQAILINNRPLGYPNYVYPFRIKPNQQNSIFLRIKASEIYGISKALVRLSDENSFHKNYRRNFFSFGMFVGFLALSFLAGVILYIFDRKHIYWIYGLYILTVLFFYLGNSGYLNALSADSFLGSARFEMGIQWISSALHIWFIEVFLNLKKQFSKPFQYFVLGLITLSLVLAFAFFFLPIPAFLLYFSRILLFIIAIFIIFLAYWGFTKKQNKTLLYSLATFPSIILISYFLFTALNLLPLHSFAYNLTFPCTVFEIIIFGVGLIYQFNEEKQAIERKLNEERTLVASKIISAQEHERQRISQDLHDDLGSTLSMLKFRLEESNKTFDNQLISEIETTNKAVEDLRQISYNLMPTMFLQRGLVIALEELINVNKIGSKVEFVHSGKEKRLDLDIELNIFRIIKELLNNALKHAKASKIEFQLIYFDDFLFISIEDNGIGFKENQSKTEGNGLKNINLRVNYLKGKLEFESSKKGTQFSIEIPYEPNLQNKTAAN